MLDLVSTDDMNRTTGDLMISWYAYDLDHEDNLDLENEFEVKWYVDESYQSTFDNQIIIGSSETLKNQKWIHKI